MLSKEEREELRRRCSTGRLVMIPSEDVLSLLADLDTKDKALRWIETYVANQPYDAQAMVMISDKVQEGLGTLSLGRAAAGLGGK